MTTTAELKRLAEAAAGLKRDAHGRLSNAQPFAKSTWFDFVNAAAKPEAILALIAERDEAVALLRDTHKASGWFDGELDDRVSAFLSRIDGQKGPAG